MKFLRLLTVAALSLCVAAGPAFSQAALLPNAKQTFVDQNGNPLALGKVYSYVPNSVQYKTTWSDSTETTANTNPVILDAAGRATIYGQGNYTQKVTDSLDNIQWTALTTAYGSSSPTGASGTDTAPVGTVMPFSGFVVPTNWQFAYGQAVSRTTYASLMTAITVVSTTASCTSASATITGWSDTSQLRIGAPIEATCIAPGATIKSVTNATTIVASANATSTAIVTMTAFPWGNGDGTSTFNVPDMRGRVAAGPDAMGGTAASRMQVSTTLSLTSGSATATAGSATGLALGMQIVNPSVPVGTTISVLSGTTVTMSALATATTNVTTRFSMLTDAQTPAGSGGAANRTIVTSNVPQLTVAITDPGHIHAMTGYLGTQNNGAIAGGGAQIAGITAATMNSATTGITATANTSSNNTTLATVQPTLTINYIVKMAPNTTGLGGVVSIGGMFGDILCGTNVTCASQTISFSGTPVLTQDQVYVGNASNQAVSVAMAGDCTIVAAGTITCTKSSGSTIGTAAFQNIGTSGANVPLLSTANTWTLDQTVASINKVALTAPATLSTLTIADGKTLTANASTTLAGTDGKTLTVSNSGTLAGGDAFVLAIAAAKTLTVSKSLTLDGTDGTTMTFPSVSATIPRTVASGTKALATGAIGSATCTAAQTATATGTLTTDVPAASFNGDPTAVTGYVPLTTGMLTIIYYPTADTVNFKVCNNTGASITPGAITLNWRVTR